jgi:hypothetical protein
MNVQFKKSAFTEEFLSPRVATRGLDNVHFLIIKKLFDTRNHAEKKHPLLPAKDRPS